MENLAELVLESAKCRINAVGDVSLHKRPLCPLFGGEILKIWKSDRVSVEADKGPDQSCFSAKILHESYQDLNSVG